MEERIAAIRGVEVVAFATVVPLSGSNHGTMLSIAGGPAMPVSLTRASANYFALLEIPIVQGREFDPRDMQAGSTAAIISQSTARRFWPDQNPVGRRLQFGRDRTPLEVVGVAKDIRHRSLAEVDPMFLYLPATPRDQMGLEVLVRAQGVASLTKAIRGEARSLDPSVLVRTSRLEDNPNMWALPAKITARLSFALGVVGLMLASLGIYGVMTYAVTQRTKEIGIRMTLGAKHGDVARLILRQAMTPVAAGIAIGMVGCAAVSRILSSLLFGVSPLDPLVFTGVAVFLAGVALVASYVPANRAGRLDPMASLRQP